MVFEACGFPVDISSTNANGKAREYPGWIADPHQRGGAVPGVVMHRRMASGMHEYIHHQMNCRLRYVSVSKGLVKAWLREEFVVKQGGRQKIQEAVLFRQRLHGDIDSPNRVEEERSSGSSERKPVEPVEPARPPTPLEERRRNAKSQDDVIIVEEHVEPDPPEIAGSSGIGWEWLPPDYEDDAANRLPPQDITHRLLIHERHGRPERAQIFTTSMS